MQPSQAALVLAEAARFDARTVGRSDADAWAKALRGLDPQRCIDAVSRHYADSTDRIMPAHIRRLARTTTDLHHGSAAATSPAEGGDVLCGTCKLMHRSTEPCHVLIADDSRWRKALTAFRRP